MPELGRWINRDPVEELGSKLLRRKLPKGVPDINLYGFVQSNPINHVDPLGLDAVPIVFPDYKVLIPKDYPLIGGQKRKLGHAGILLINPKNGLTKYYEYGRYDFEGDECDCGGVRSFPAGRLPDVVMGEDGKPTPDSLQRTLKAISEFSGQGGQIAAAYIDNPNFETMNQYALNRMKQNTKPNRKRYNFRKNNCGTFMYDVLEAGGAKTPWVVNPTPHNYIDELREDYPDIDFKP